MLVWALLAIRLSLGPHLLFWGSGCQSEDSAWIEACKQPPTVFFSLFQNPPNSWKMAVEFFFFLLVNLQKTELVIQFDLSWCHVPVFPLWCLNPLFAAEVSVCLFPERCWGFTRMRSVGWERGMLLSLRHLQKEPPYWHCDFGPLASWNWDRMNFCFKARPGGAGCCGAL